MNKFKKIGLTALAASLVSVSAHAGALTISGAASMSAGAYSGEGHDGGTTFSMGNQMTVSGGGELDNGMTVSLSFQLDDTKGSPFEDQSISVSSDAMGTLVLHGRGGGSATSAMDATAAGNLWDTFDTIGLATGVTHTNTAPGENAFMYTLPAIMDGVAVNVSYEPQASGNTTDSGMGWAVTYTGVEGLTAIYSMSDEVGTTSALSGEQTAWKLSYAYGPITATATGSDFDVQTASSDQDVSSYAVSYTVSDELSVSYGTETIESGTSGDQDAEYNKLSAAYTSGGMTVSAQIAQAENIDHSTNANADLDYWGLGLAFAF
ncbi:porin [Candidatus Pelagibacter bacterium]|nr:porin [Candidatus Pelagibacter bacterium]